jgi:hypothetical protein
MRRGDLIGVAAADDLLNRFAAAEDMREEPISDRLRSAARQEVGVAEVMLAPDAPRSLPPRISESRRMRSR